MKEYFFPFAAYLVLPILLGIWISSPWLVYGLTAIMTLAIVAHFYRQYGLNWNLGWNSLLTAAGGGIVIYLTWVLLEGTYPLLLPAEALVPSNALEVAVRALGFVIAAPLVEELFTRGFLLRYFISDKWKTVKPGTFTWLSFIGTTLFFGFSHSEWLQGLVAGVLLNVIYYRTSRVEPCIIAHAVANALLMINM